eukprot:5632126-Amphidinium_carterae.2
MRWNAGSLQVLPNAVVYLILALHHVVCVDCMLDCSSNFADDLAGRCTPTTCPTQFSTAAGAQKPRTSAEKQNVHCAIRLLTLWTFDIRRLAWSRSRACSLWL